MVVSIRPAEVHFTCLLANVGMVSKPANEGQETTTAVNCLAIQHGSCCCGGSRCCCCWPIRSLCLHDAVNCSSVTSPRPLSILTSHTSNCTIPVSAVIIQCWFVGGSTGSCSPVVRRRRLVATELPGCIHRRPSSRYALLTADHKL